MNIRGRRIGKIELLHCLGNKKVMSFQVLGDFPKQDCKSGNITGKN
jgi:hypothetical protein